jgi:hypothetical protein
MQKNVGRTRRTTAVAEGKLPYIEKPLRQQGEMLTIIIWQSEGLGSRIEDATRRNQR